MIAPPAAERAPGRTAPTRSDAWPGSSVAPGSAAARRPEGQAGVLQLHRPDQGVEARSPADFDGTFSDITRARAGALAVLPDHMFTIERRRLVDLAAKNRLPTIFPYSDFVDAGGLMTYGPNLVDWSRRAATYVDKILKGAKPADLPFEQPTRFELVINLKTAKALGLTIPPSLLQRADQVIE